MDNPTTNGLNRKSWVTDRPIDYVLTLDYPLFSKARPRMTRNGHTYMPPAYKEAQYAIKEQLRKQWFQPPLEGPVHLHLIVYGEGRGDTDNIAGAFMDSAHNILFVDDRVTVIPVLSIEWHKARKVDSKWIVQITHLDR